jgi:hypothetical protein
MSKAAFSVRVFSLYLSGVGALLVLAPNLLLSIFAVAPTHEVWLRVVGMVLLVISYYYFRAAGAEMTELLRWSVHGRLSVPVFFAAFVGLGLAPPILILFGLVEAAGAIWTLTALAKDKA